MIRDLTSKTAGKGICQENAVYLDWFYQLPEGHRVYASAFAAAGQIYFGTSTAETEDPCASSSDPNVTAGKLFAFDMDQSYNLDATPSLEEEVGDILVSPIVEDRHLFVNSKENGLQAYGSGKFNNKVTKSGNPQVFVRFWREMYSALQQPLRLPIRRVQNSSWAKGRNSYIIGIICFRGKRLSGPIRNDAG